MQLLKVCDLRTGVVVGEGVRFSDGMIAYKMLDSYLVVSPGRFLQGWNLLPVGSEYCVTEVVTASGD